MKAIKGIKPKKEWHASSSKIGMGDYQGVGVKQKVGTSTRNYMINSLSPKKIGKPPKSMA